MEAPQTEVKKQPEEGEEPPAEGEPVANKSSSFEAWKYKWTKINNRQKDLI